MEKFLKLQSLLTYVMESHHSSFYRKRLGTSLKEVTTLDGLVLLPSTSKEDISGTPLGDRMYINRGRGFMKIVDSETEPFLIKRVLAELKEEQFGCIGERPTVLFSNGHESLEKSLWCYEQNVLPVIGESTNIPVTDFLIHRYESDSFLGDVNSLKLLVANNADIFSHGETFNLYGSDFNISEINERISLDKVNLILSLPEVGAFAYSCPHQLKEGRLLFHPDKNSIVELDKRLIVTKLIHMPTPIIRYVTNINSEEKNHACACEEEVSFSINSQQTVI